MFRFRFMSALLLLLSGGVASAHEFWIGPENFSLAPDEELVAHLRVGEAFSGSSFSFIPAQFDRFELRQGDSLAKISSRIGDRPALSQSLPGEGLWTIVHETRDSYLTYNDEGQFANFVKHKDLKGVMEEHANRGFQETGFTESYRRFAKSLVAVGAGHGADVVTGMRTEILALSNPYAPDFDGVMKVKVLFESAPSANIQVEVFERASDATVSIGTVRTDANGQVSVPVKPGHSYLFDSVTMLPIKPTQENRNSVWQSLWASLTFAVPG